VPADELNGGVPADALAILAEAEIELEGRMPWSSNATFLVNLGDTGSQAIYKPVRGERPLWDYPDGTLAGREVAAAVVSELGGWHLVPPTVLRDGPLGPGSVQLWIGDPYRPLADDVVVDLVPEGRTPPGWHEVIEGETPGGSTVTVVHSGAWPRTVVGGQSSAEVKSMLLPEAKPCLRQSASAAETQSGAPFGAAMQRSRPLIMRAVGSLATASIALLVASAAPLPTSAAPLPTLAAPSEKPLPLAAASSLRSSIFRLAPRRWSRKFAAL